MSTEQPGSVEVVMAPLPNYMQEKETGKVYELGKEVPAGVFVTELDPHTFEPIPGSDGLSQRELLAQFMRPFPYADNKFFKDLMTFKEVQEIATETTFSVLNCNLDEATLINAETNQVKIVPIEILYGAFKIMKGDLKNATICTTCRSTSLSADRVLN